MVAGINFYLQWAINGNILVVGRTGCDKTKELIKNGSWK